MADMIPYMRLYPSDYRRDTMHLSTLEHGAYLLLIMAYWERREPLPDDDRRLAKLTGLDTRTWRKMRADMERFFVVENGTWMHKRIDREIALVANKSQKSAIAGKASGKARANGRSTGVPVEFEPQPNHVKTSDERESSFPANAEKETLPRAAPARSFDVWWEAYPKKTGKADADRRYVAVCKKLMGERGMSKPQVQDFLLRAIGAWKQANKGLEPKFVPNPATWLNQGRYDDGPVVKIMEGPGAQEPGKPAAARKLHPDIVPDVARSTPEPLTSAEIERRRAEERDRQDRLYREEMEGSGG